MPGRDECPSQHFLLTHSTTLSHTQARCSNASSSLPLLCPARLRKRSSPAEVRAPAPHGAHIHLACAVSSTLPPTVGACGRPCNGTITCKSTVGPNEACSGADAAVPYNIFFACAHCCLSLCSFTDAPRSNYNASLPAAKNPICGHHVECKRAHQHTGNAAADTRSGSHRPNLHALGYHLQLLHRAGVRANRLVVVGPFPLPRLGGRVDPIQLLNTPYVDTYIIVRASCTASILVCYISCILFAVASHWQM
jgi:hypothetical protein